MLNSDSTVDKEDTIVMYQCSTQNGNQTCKRTYGYAEISKKYYEIADISKELFKDDISNDKRAKDSDSKEETQTEEFSEEFSEKTTEEFTEKTTEEFTEKTTEGIEEATNNESCSSNSLFGLLFNDFQNRISLCLGGIINVYRIGNVTFKILGETKIVKFIRKEKYGISYYTSDFRSTNANYIFNVIVSDSKISQSDVETINADKWYFGVYSNYDCSDYSCITEVLVGVGSSLSDDVGDISNSYGDKTISFPQSIYDNKNYLLNVKAGNKISSGPFNTALKNLKVPNSSSAGIVVSSIAADNSKGTPALIAFNNFYSKINYCLDDKTNEIISRRTNICINRSLDCSYYYCDSGICEPSSDTCPDLTKSKCDPRNYELQSNCENGYYLVDNGIVKEINGIGYLYYCENRSCSQIDRAGLFKNADTTNNIPFIKCSNKYKSEDNYSNQCVGLPYPGNKETKCSNPGDLINVTKDNNENEVHICLFGSGSKKTVTFTSEDADPILITSGHRLFGLVTNSGNIDLLVLKVDALSIYVVNGSFLITKNSEIATTANQKGKHYICINNYICFYEFRVGYYYNELNSYDPTAVPFIQCDRSECSTIEITKTSCSSSLTNDESIAKEGELFITTQRDSMGNDIVNYNICLDTTVDQPISFNLGNRNNIYNYDYYINSYELLISSNNRNSIFPYNPNKYLIIYISNLDIQLEYRNDLYYLADPYNKIYRKYRMNEENCPSSDSIIEFEILCPYDPDYKDAYSYYKKIIE